MINLFRCFIITALFIFFSCEKTYEKKVITVDSLPIIQDRTVQSYNLPIANKDTFLVQAEDTSILDSTPEITKLPFNAHYGYDEMSALTKKSPAVYRLPPIEKINYVTIDSSYGYCLDHKGVDTSTFKFKKYRYKLPDIHGYESYLICDTTFANYGIKFPKRCGAQFYILIHGYLFLYNRQNKEAIIIELYYQNYPSNKRRTFYIDKNFVIYLWDYRYFEFDEDEKTPIKDRIPLIKYTVHINPDGVVKVTKILDLFNY